MNEECDDMLSGEDIGRAKRSGALLRGIAVLALVLMSGGGKGASAELTDAQREAIIAEVGVSRVEVPDNGACFFLDGAFIEPPYIVERRGLEVYVNGNLVGRPVREWPPFDERMPDDPGPPPPNSHPLKPEPGYVPGSDHRNDYWARKGRYLIQHYDQLTANRMYFEALRESSTAPGSDWTVRMDEKSQDIVIVKSTGEEMTMGSYGLDPAHPRGPREVGPPPTASELRPGVEEEVSSWVTFLSGQCATWLSSIGGELSLRPEDLFEVAEVLLGDLDDEEKFNELKRLGLMSGDDFGRTMVAGFHEKEQLARRVAAIKKMRAEAEAEAEKAKETKANADAAWTTLNELMAKKSKDARAERTMARTQPSPKEPISDDSSRGAVSPSPADVRPVEHPSGDSPDASEKPETASASRGVLARYGWVAAGVVAALLLIAVAAILTARRRRTRP